MRDLDWKSFDVLVVDDEQDNLDAFRFAFRKSFTLHYALGGMDALSALVRIDPAVVVTDQRMPGMSGIELLRRAKEVRPDAVGVLLTAYADMPVLVDAINSGAVFRYVQKPWDNQELAAIVRQAITVFATMRENRRLREQLAHYAGYLEREQRDPIDFGELICESAAMKEVSARIGEVAPTATHVLVEGQPGAEKEIVARAIHVGSPREERPFVKVTCAAFRGEALERELFGWRRGAFDGAFDDRAGRFELAHGGTLYLEDPGPPSPSLQARLLRALGSGEVERIGASDPVRVDVRLIVSVTGDLDEAWGREVLPELGSRLSVFPIRLPPLRDRREDIRALAEHFLRKYARRNARAATSLSDEAVSKLEGYAFPGNVRELENVIERAAILARGDVILPEHLAFAQRAPSWEKTASSRDPITTQAAPAEGDRASRRVSLDSQLEEIERRELLAALERCGGNKAEVARMLGVQRTTLYYRMKRLGIEI
ncbi:sigma-54-dependent transcriptional regulator [Polyangium aurulentum]|uniref:sigma-54-dependent transcriptional regulator n=1 Tax=Polyangium aurulentum TaxID=2567896 RepID=UPI0010AE5607|nr:sigma-54 dependent transcriptional regulator [Polyangium aurulentum]UQA63418.1 sigma-54 dependent transcriptional regulator [Polyangium aurulentum]